MSDEVSPETIKKTQEALSKYVKESLLNEKFLRKLPFRYIQDVVKNVVKETNFMKEVFSQEDFLDYGKDKERKVVFLKKLINAVQEATGEQVAAKPNKIVVGLEVPKTLELFQQIGKAVVAKDGVKKSVKREDSKEKKKRDTSLSKEKKPKTKPEPVKSDENLRKKKAKPDSKENEKDKKKRDSAKENKTDEEKKKRKPSLENQVDKKQIQDEKKERKSSSRKSAKEPKPEVPDENEKQESEEPKASSLTEPEENKEEKQDNLIEKENAESPKIEAQTAPKIKERRPSSRRVSAKKSEKIEKVEKVVEKPKEPEVPLLGADTPVAVPKVERPKTARKAPPSARPGVPKARDLGEVKQDLNASSSEVEAKPVAVIAETDTKDDDKENMVVLEAQLLSIENEVQNGVIVPEFEESLGENEGALVAQILETKKELEENKRLWSPSSNKVEIEWEGGKKQKREAIIKEVNKMKEGIQQLTRATNPLGKLFDFLQEDVDSMQRELKLWTETNANYSKQFKEEQKLSEISLEMYKRQLADLDSLIEQEQEAVRNLKANTLANDKKIINIVTRLP